VRTRKLPPISDDAIAAASREAPAGAAAPDVLHDPQIELSALRAELAALSTEVQQMRDRDNAYLDELRGLNRRLGELRAAVVAASRDIIRALAHLR
jgi:septal ring factor EnvC (AmiA/AmiB activator)